MFVPPPRSPRLNRHVERSNRHKQEFYYRLGSTTSLARVNKLLWRWEDVCETPLHRIGPRLDNTGWPSSRVRPERRSEAYGCRPTIRYPDPTLRTARRAHAPALTPRTPQHTTRVAHPAALTRLHARSALTSRLTAAIDYLENRCYGADTITLPISLKIPRTSLRYSLRLAGGLAAAAIVLAGATLLGTSSTGQAAFPGVNDKIVFASDRDSSNGSTDIYSVDPDGGNIQRLTTDATNDDPAVSPDGTKIAFSSTRTGDNEIYTMDANGSNQTRVTFVTGDDDDVTWSPDGSKLAFETDRDGTDEIYIMNANGSGQASLTDGDGGSHPQFSPDGTKIVFDSIRSLEAEVWVMNANGTNPVNLTQNPAGDQFPTWSPDGGKIAFAREGDIWVMNANGSGQANLTNDASYQEAPVWSPDGTKIAFHRDVAEQAEVGVMNANGSNLQNITNNPAYDDNADWGPAVATPTPTPSPTPTHSPTPSPTPSHSPTPSPTHSPKPTPTPTTALVWGDNDCSGGIDGVDGLLALIHAAGMPAAFANATDCPNLGQQIGFPGGPLWGDLNCSGSIDAEDMIAELRYVLGLDYERALDCALIGQEIGPL